MKETTPKTLIEHVYELRRRFFWVALWFVAASSVVFPFFGTVIKLLMRPLGNEKLYYLTPVGGLGFMVKVSMYLGLIATLPILLYHIYGFIAPVVRKHNARLVVLYVIMSFVLATIGIVFAYVVSLPAAMHFLTHVDINGVSPMLTVDSYLSFIIAYLLAGALLFQLPLVMLVIDSIKPTPPSTWLKYERHVIVAVFIIAMLVTPTPNIIDQVMIALPMLLMYQIGIGLIAYRHHKRQRALARHARKQSRVADVTPSRPLPVAPSSAKQYTPPVVPAVALRPKPKTMDFGAPIRSSTIHNMMGAQPQSQPQTRTQLAVPAPRGYPAMPTRQTLRRGIDGISVF